MAEIGDKVFTTDMIQLIKDAVKAELGTNAYVNRYLAEVTAVNTTTSEVSVKLSGSDSVSDSFRARGIQLPSVGEQVIACIDGQDRWIESVVRATTSTPYLQIASGSLVGAGSPTGAVLGYLFATPPSGWLLCNGGTHDYNTYPALGALFGAVGGGSFTLPDMRDRFIAGLGTVGTWSNTAGAIGPDSTITNSRSHTHSTSHSHNHDHTFTGSSHTHGSGTYNPVAMTIGALATTQAGGHSHTAPIAAENTGQPSTTVNRDSGGTAASTASSTHTHSTSAGAWTTTTAVSHDHDVTIPSHDHTINGDSAGSTASGTISSDNTLDTTATGAATYSGSDIAPKSTLINFIIKT